MVVRRSGADTMPRHSTPTLARLTGRKIPPGVLALVPRGVCRQHRALPLGLVAHRGRWTLVVAMARPGDVDALHDLSYASGLTVQGVLADETEILAVLEKGSGPDADAVGHAVPSTRLPGWGPLFEVVEPVFATDWVI
jgi:hypothetical protein